MKQATKWITLMTFDYRGLKSGQHARLLSAWQLKKSDNKQMKDGEV